VLVTILNQLKAISKNAPEIHILPMEMAIAFHDHSCQLCSHHKKFSALFQNCNSRKNEWMDFLS
jgi:hypothetical protein